MSRATSEKEGEAGRRRDPHALDDAGPHLGEQSEADEGGAEDPELNEQARHEDAPGVGGGKPRGRGDAFEQWPEQGQVEQRLDEAEDHPHRISQRQPQGAGEHEAGRGQQGHGSASGSRRGWARRAGRGQ